MKISKNKLSKLCAIVGLSSALILSGCSVDSEKEVYKLKNGKKVTKEYKDDEEGYYNNGTFVPFVFSSSNSKYIGNSSNTSKSSSSSKGSTGLGSSKGGASS